MITAIMVAILIFATTEKSFRSSGQTSSMTQGNPPFEVGVNTIKSIFVRIVMGLQWTF